MSSSVKEKQNTLSLQGLGKTLQSITLVWTLLRQGFNGTPLAKRVVIVTPTSLVGSWENEFSKWLPGKVYPVLLTRGGNLQAPWQSCQKAG
jgi:SNF2 family DNA or RNA helicase